MDDAKSINLNKGSDNPNEIKFDVLKIDSSIKKEGKYQEEENIFQFYPDYEKSKDEEDQ